MESSTHKYLKKQAVKWLYNKGCKIIITELKYEKYIFDVVGLTDSEIYIVEAKASIQDYKRELNLLNEYKEKFKQYSQNRDNQLKKELQQLKKKFFKFGDYNLFNISNYRYIITTEYIIENYGDITPANWGIISEDLLEIKKCQQTKINKIYYYKFLKLIAKKLSYLYWQL